MNDIFLKSKFIDSESELNRPEWLSIIDHKTDKPKQKGGSYDLNKMALSLDSEMPYDGNYESTEVLEEKLRNLLSGQSGGKKKSKVDLEVVGKRKTSKSKKSKKTKKVSKSKKSKKQKGGAVHGVRKLKGGMSESESEEVDMKIESDSESESTPFESSDETEKEEPKKEPKQKEKSGRTLPPALVKRQQVQKHVGEAVKAAGKKYNVGKIAKVVSRVIEESGAGNGAEMDSSKAIKYFDSNKSKYMSDL